MSQAQNLAYALVQVAHNYGAVASVGGSLAACFFAGKQRTIPLIVLIGWGVQGASGAAFGAASWYFMHRFPDIGPVATDALYIKIGCVLTGFSIAAYGVFKGGSRQAWIASFILALTALTSAAVLRWFS